MYSIPRTGVATNPSNEPVSRSRASASVAAMAGMNSTTASSPGTIPYSDFRAGLYQARPRTCMPLSAREAV